MTTKINAGQPIVTSPSPLKTLLWVSPLAIAISTVANLGLYAAAGAVFPEVTSWSGAGIGQIIGANIGYLFFGTVVFALIAKFSARPARTYWIVSMVGLLLSLGLPISAWFGTPPASIATIVTLSLMHVISFAISVPMFIRNVLN